MMRPHSSAEDYARYGSATTRREWYEPGAFVATHVGPAWLLTVDLFSDGGMAPWLRAFRDRFCVGGVSP